MYRTSCFRRAAAVSAACAALAIVPTGPARAADDDARIKALEEKLARSLAQIEQLGQRVQELERERAAARKPSWGDAAPVAAVPAASAASGPGTGPSLASLQAAVEQITEGLNRHAGADGTQLHGFLDVGGGWDNRGDALRQRGFTGGSMDLYLTPQIGSRVKSLIELVFEFEEEGKSFDMERIQIGYTFADELTLWAGRFHTPIGIWNSSFHHGANLQTSITRPSFVEFEDRGGLAPAHSVGLWATGKLPLGDSRMTYDLYVANGPAVRERHLDPNTFTDDNADKLTGFNLGYEPWGATGGLKFGLHGYAHRVTSFGPGDNAFARTRVRMLGGYFGYESNAWEMFGEYYRYGNTDVAGGPRLRSQAGFVHVGRSFGAWTPYVRLERASLDARDAYFRSQRTGRSFRHAVAGVRYALDANASLKLELRRSREAAAALLDDAGAVQDVDPVSYQRALFQYSIAF